MQKNDILTLKIEDLNNLGCGVGHLGAPDGSRGLTVFVKGAVTGDEIEARVIKVNRSYLVARMERLITPSPYREETDACASSEGCGGCVYRHVRYEHELELKRGYVKGAFCKAGLPDVPVAPVISTRETVGYRNKAQYPVCAGKSGMEAGFFATGTHRTVPAKACGLQPAVFSELTAFLCRFCDRNGISAYNEERRSGLLRHIYLRMGKATGQIMACLVVNGKSLPAEAALVRELTAAFPSVVSVMLNRNEKDSNVVLGESFRCLYGQDYIEDELCGVRLRISAGSFYQVNHDACEKLYRLARERAGLSGGETLLDLYCGIGSIGLSMADTVSRLIGIEIVDEAVLRATENAERNGVRNAAFYCGDAADAEKLLRTAEAAEGELDPAQTVVILDPPRKGSTPELIRYLSRRDFCKIVYISCNPDTLARDCSLFASLGYEIGEVTPVDLFPRTGHVETVVLMSRDKE